ncbi:hypothetical protein ACRC7T_16145 [Segnochrobactraceae bacterium EtOH-i3]
MAEVKRMTDAKKPELDDVADDLAMLKADIAKLTETLAGLVSAHTATVSETAEAKAKVAAETLKGATDRAFAEGQALAAEARVRAQSLGADVQGVIERNPTTSVLTALGVGLLVGFLSRGRGA